MQVCPSLSVPWTDSISSLTLPILATGYSATLTCSAGSLSLYTMTVLWPLTEIVPPWKAWARIVCLHWIQQRIQPVYSRGQSVSIASLHPTQLWELALASTKMLADTNQLSLPSFLTSPFKYAHMYMFLKCSWCYQGHFGCCICLYFILHYSESC